MTVPAAFAQVDLPAFLFEFRVGRSLAGHPFELAEVRAHHAGDFRIAALRLDGRQDSLRQHGEEQQAEAGPENDDSRRHAATCGSAVCGAACCARAGYIRLTTSRLKPMSI